MLSREVWGWRLLALLLAALLVSTIPQLETLEEGWRDSIESTSSEDNQQNSDGDSFDEETADGEMPEEGSATQDSDVQTTEDDASPPAAEFARDEDAGPTNTNSAPEWVLPATQVIVLSMMAIMAVGLLTSTSVAILTSEAARFTILLAILGPIIAITQRGEGGIFTRGRILGFIEAHPGIHFSALRDALSLGNGVTAHHIQILEKEGRIITWIDGKVRRFSSSGIDQKRLKEIQSPVVGMQIAILQILAENEQLGIKSGELRTKLETSRQLLSYHMKQLSEREFVSSSGKGRALRWSLLEKGKKQLESSAHLLLTAND